MPWQETNPVLERRHFIHDAQSGHWRMSELCLRYGVSRVTGYKWLERYQQGGAAFLLDQSRGFVIITQRFLILRKPGQQEVCRPAPGELVLCSESFGILF